MARHVSSKRIANSTELMLRIPVRNEFVQHSPRLMSVATRLQKLLEGLFAVRKQQAERLRVSSADPIHALQSIYATQWAVLERPGASELMVASSFDRNWEDYFQLLVTQTGDLLDAIFCHCQGYAGHTCQDGFEPFIEWIRQHQVTCHFYYAAAPDLTTDDLRCARRQLAEGGRVGEPLPSLEQEERETLERRRKELMVARGVGEAQLDREAIADRCKVVKGFYELSRFFPEDERVGEGTHARDIYSRAMHSLLARHVIPEGKARGPVFDALPAEQKAWVGTWFSIPRKQPRAVTLDEAQYRALQGNVLEPYRSVPASPDDGDPGITHGCVVLLGCDDQSAMRDLLHRLKGKVTRAHPRGPEGGGTPTPTKPFLNLAITYGGLRRLQVSQAYMDLLPKEFVEGMAERSGGLGDVGYPNHPSYWERPVLNGDDAAHSDRTVDASVADVVLLVQARADDTTDDHLWSTAHPLFKTLQALELAQAGTRVLHVQPLRRFHRGGHFDMPEGPGVSSQPVPRLTVGTRDLTEGVAERDQVALGDLILGYEDSRGEIAACARDPHSPFRDGSFLVMRKLQQNVEALDDLLEQGGSEGPSRECVKQWVLGRRQNGAPMVDEHGTRNDFDYSDEVQSRCLLHSHIRRANPRTGDVPRLVRRGFSYGSQTPKARTLPDGASERDTERGLMFMGYNASIARQFEVVQRWLNGGNSTGLPSVHNDMLTGGPQPSCDRWIQDGEQTGATDAWQRLRGPRQPLVTLRWGMYLFVPSIRAIESFAGVRCDPHVAAAVETLEDVGKGLVGQLDAITDHEQARHAWKVALEEKPEQAAAVWAYLRTREAPHEARHYGRLIAHLQAAREVLEDKGERYSVLAYAERLTATIGPHYLGVDPATNPGAYADAAKANAYIAALPHEDTDLWGFARRAALEFLQQESRSAEPAPIDLVRFVKVAVAKISRDLIGIPGLEGACSEVLIETIDRFASVSRYCFQPYPADWLKELAEKDGRDLQCRYAATPLAELGPLAKAVGEPAPAAGLAARGAVVGFAPPAIGGLVQVLSQWLDSRRLWDLNARRGSASSDLATWRKAVLGGLVEALVRAPVPPLLYRTALPQNGATEEKIVVVGTQSVVRDAQAKGQRDSPWQWLFGGPASGQTAHGCPGREPAVALMGGIVDALLCCEGILKEGEMSVSVGSVPSSQ